MIAVTLTRTQINRLSDVLPNNYDYVLADGTLDPTCCAYRLGMRNRDDLDELIKLVKIGKANRKTLTITEVQARVLRDRLEMVYEIASDNVYESGDEYDIEARRYRDGMDRITAALEARA